MVACAATDTSAAGQRKTEPLECEDPLFRLRTRGNRLIQQRYPDAKRPPVNRAVTFDAAHKSQSRFRDVFHGRHTISSTLRMLIDRWAYNTALEG